MTTEPHAFGTDLFDAEDWLAEVFFAEYCGGRGLDGPDHHVGPDPFGLPHARASHPIPVDDGAEYERVLMARAWRQTTGRLRGSCDTRPLHAGSGSVPDRVK